SDKPGVVILAGRRASWGRPAATIVITHSGGTTLRRLLAAAVRGVGTGQPLHFLGERRLGSDRLARDFTPWDRPTAQYVMVGVAARARWMVMIIGIDLVGDPMLHLSAEVLQGLLLDLTFPVVRNGSRSPQFPPGVVQSVPRLEECQLGCPNIA